MSEPASASETAEGHSRADTSNGSAPGTKPNQQQPEQAGPAAPTRRSFSLHAAIIGLAAGLIAVLFGRALYMVEERRFALLNYLHEHYPDWGWAILPAAALVIGSVVGLMVQKIEPDSSGSGIPHIKSVILRLRPMHWHKLLPVKFIGGVLGVGVGLSLGREGPTVQLGAALAQMLSQYLRVPPRVVGQLISCGAGAGLAAAFNAPLAGFVFVIEELRREMSRLTYAGALIAAVCADIVTRSLIGEFPSFHLPQGLKPAPLPVQSLPAVALVGVVGSLCAVVFNKLLVNSRKVAPKMKVPQWTLPGIAAALCALTAWWLPQVVGGGNITAEHALVGHFAEATPWFILLMLLVKFALTIISYGSGAPGGIFAPMLLMGTFLGLLVGRGVHAIFPNQPIDETSMAIIGMAAFFAGSVRAPLTGTVLILEMSGNYELLFPIAASCLVSYLLADWLRDPPVYEALMELELRRRGLHEDPDEPTPVVMGIQHGSALDGKRLRDAGLPAGCWVVGIERRGHELAPTGDTELQPGDHVTILVPGDAPSLALKIVEMCRVP